MKRDIELAKYLVKLNQKLKKRVVVLEKTVAELTNTRDFLTIKEVEKEFGISSKTLSRYRAEGLKVMQPKRNGKILVKRTELDKFLNDRK